ncbi:hypothetical protein VRB44_04570 [Pseudomonas trivialis]|uniref:hypothetical protein n=1 Tax=Pseudomonas trivialis TaxID=200450 RepID=UPI0030D2DF3B
MRESTPSKNVPTEGDSGLLFNYLPQDTGSEAADLSVEQTKPKPPALLADPEFDMRGVAWNPLCDAATPLIGLVIRLRRLDHHDDVPALYLSVSNQITTIMEEVSQLDYDAGMLKALLLQPVPAGGRGGHAHHLGQALHVERALIAKPVSWRNPRRR